MTLFKPNFLQVYTAPRMLTFLLEDREYFDFDVYLPTIEENLQRPFVWEKEAIKNGFDKFHYHRLLIDNIFNYINIGKIVLYGNSNIDFTISVLDGKQRMQALFDFYDNKFGIFRDGVEYFKKDMGNVAKKILNTCINYCEIDSEHQKLSDNDLIELFLNINTAGVPQSEAHLQKLQNLKK